MESVQIRHICYQFVTQYFSLSFCSLTIRYLYIYRG